MKPSPLRYLASLPFILIGIVAGFIWQAVAVGVYAGQSYVNELAEASVKKKK